MEDQEQIPPTIHDDPGTVPEQPKAAPGWKKSMPVVYGLCGLLLLIFLANISNIFSGKREVRHSSLPLQPSSPDAQQVRSFQDQQKQIAQTDEENRTRQQQLAAQMAELNREESVPGPESANAALMTSAQRAAMYGNSPNAPKNTSNVSEAAAEAKQRELAREKQHQDALNSDTVAIDFAHATTTTAKSTVAASSDSQASSSDILAQPSETAAAAGSPATDTASDHPAALRNAAMPEPGKKDAMASYDFDGYQGRLYRVFEGTVFEGVVTNHIDGALAGPIIVMLTTDYYSHDHQEMLLPQGTRLIGEVRSVGNAQQRKLFVVFNRAICPDGFSLELNKYLGLDPLGTSGLATNVNNHYLSSFAAAAAIGGLGGLAQIGNNGSILTADTQIRNGMTEQTAQESEQILDHFLNRLPVITVKEGSRARVYINQDILIPSYAEHRVDPAM